MLNSMDKTRETSNSVPKQRRVLIDVTKNEPSQKEIDNDGLPPKVPSVSRVNNSSEEKKRPPVIRMQESNVSLQSQS